MRVNPLGLLITALWLAMMALLVRDHLLPHPVGRNAELISSAQLTDEWHDVHDALVIRRGPHLIGASALTLEQMPQERGYHASQSLKLTFGSGQLQPTVTLQGAATLDEALVLERFWVRLNTIGLQLTARGQANDNRLLFEITGPTGRRLFVQPLDEPVSLLDAIRPRVFENVRLEPGASYRIPSADLFGSFAVSDFVIEVQDYDLVDTSLGRLPAYRILTQFAGMQSTAWVDESGRLLIQQLWGDILLERAAPRLMERHFPDVLQPVELPDFDLTPLAASAEPWSTDAQSLFSLRGLVRRQSAS